MENNELVTNYCVKNNLTISFMESCTSGLLASMFTDTEGASKVFKGSLVTYSNEEKIRAGVAATIIEDFSVYSNATTRAMAEAVKNRYQSNIAIGVSGTTGNIDPNNKSVTGKCFFTIIVNDRYYDFEFNAEVEGKSRKEIKQMYADFIYEKLACEILDM